MFLNLLIALGAVGAAFVGARFLYQKDSEMEDRRRAALKMSAAMKSKGLTRVGDFFEDYAVGDYSGMLKKLKDAAVVLSHDAALQDEFEGVFDNLLASKLLDPVAAADIAQKALAAVPPASVPAVAAPAAGFTAEHVTNILTSVLGAVKAATPIAMEVAKDAAAVAAVVG